MKPGCPVNVLRSLSGGFLMVDFPETRPSMISECLWRPSSDVSRWVFWRWKKQKTKLTRWWFLFALQFAVLVIRIEDPNWPEKTNMKTCIDWNHQPNDVHNIYMCKYVYICTGLADNLNLRDKTWLLLEDPVIFPVKILAVFEFEVLSKTTDFIGKKSGHDCI